jgi:uncharacterized protein with HEPN domain
MQEEVKVWLEDIEKPIAEIEVFLPNPRNFLEFEKDLKTIRAVQRNIEIILNIYPFWIKRSKH